MSVGKINILIGAGTAGLETDFSRASKLAGATATNIRGEFEKVDFHESRAGAALMNELLGTHMPRHLQTLIATLPGVGIAFQAALPAIAAVVFIQKIVELVEHVNKASEAAKKAAGEYGDLAQATERHAQGIALQNLKLADQLRILQGVPTKNGPAIAMEEARIKAEELTAQIVKAIEAEEKLLKEQSVGFWKGLLGDTKTSDIVEIVTQGKAAIAELERQKGVALTAHDDALVASLQKELDTKRSALQTELETRKTAEDTARNDKLAKDIDAARAAAANAKPILAFGQTQSAQEQIAASMALHQEIAKHEAAINEPVNTRIKLYDIAIEQLKAETEEQKDQLRNAQLSLAIDKERDTLRNVFENTNKSKLSTGSSHDSNGKFVDSDTTKANKDADANLAIAQALNHAHQFDAKTQADINRELDAQRDKWNEISALTTKDALATQEHIYKMQEASGLITKRQADAQIAVLYANAELADQQKLNDQITRQLALVMQLNALTKGGTAGSEADRAAYKHALEEYQKFLLAKENAKAASDKKIFKAEEDAAAKTFAIQKRTIEGVTNLLNSGVQGWISGQETFAQAAQKAFASFAESALMGFVKAAEQSIIYHLLNKEMDEEDKLDDAKTSARKVFKSVMGSEIPFPLNTIIAPVAAAGAFAAAMAFEHGGEVPDSVATGVPAILHPREMVLDKALADVVRSAAANHSNGGNNGGNTNHVFAPRIGNGILATAEDVKNHLKPMFEQWVRSEARKRFIRY
jgi:hypothetical protein